MVGPESMPIEAMASPNTKGGTHQLVTGPYYVSKEHWTASGASHEILVGK